MKKNSEFFKNAKKVWPYLNKCKGSLIGYAMVSIIGAVVGVIWPLVSAKLILNITDAAITQLLYSALAVLGIEILSDIVDCFKGIFYQNIYRATVVNLQMAVAKEMLKIEIREIDKNSSGLFIDRLNKDTKEISGIFMEYTFWLSTIIANIGVLFTIFVLNRYLFGFAVVSSICCFAINKKRINKQYEVQKNVHMLQEKKTGLTAEIVKGIKDIKVMNAEETVLKQVGSKIQETSNEEIKMLKIRRQYFLYEYLVKAFSDFLFIALGCYLYNKGLLVIPTFVIIYNYQSKVKNLLTGVGQLIEFNKKFTISSSRIFEIIDDEKFSKEKFGKDSIPKLNGLIEFKDVSFGYDEEKKILDKMNFKIEPNQKVAFVGKSGVGKTTIFNLMTKLYKTDGGTIYLDGKDIEEFDCSSIRNNMSIITQNPYIFNLSIKDNLLLAKEDATMKEIREACKMACIDDYIMALKDQYDTILGENGVILSGGQKQRLAIARGLLMKTEMMPFDEATSALDNETQTEIQRAIDNLKGEYTVLIIAHRLSTIIDSDKIFVVDEGKIVAEGNHKTLLKTCEIYRNLYEKDLEI